MYTRALFSYVARASNFKFKIWFERYITLSVYSCFLSTDEEAAASKCMEVLSTFSRNNEYPLSFLIEQTLRNTLFFLFYFPGATL